MNTAHRASQYVILLQKAIMLLVAKYMPLVCEWHLKLATGLWHSQMELKYHRGLTCFLQTEATVAQLMHESFKNRAPAAKSILQLMVTAADEVGLKKIDHAEDIKIYTGNVARTNC